MIKEKEVTLLFFFLAKSVIPDYSKKSRERQSENDKLRKTVGSENENEVIHEATSFPGLFHRNLRKSPENQVGHEVVFSALFTLLTSGTSASN